MRYPNIPWQLLAFVWAITEVGSITMGCYLLLDFAEPSHTTTVAVVWCGLFLMILIRGLMIVTPHEKDPGLEETL